MGSPWLARELWKGGEGGGVSVCYVVCTFVWSVEQTKVGVWGTRFWGLSTEYFVELAAWEVLWAKEKRRDDSLGRGCSQVPEGGRA